MYNNQTIARSAVERNGSTDEPDLQGGIVCLACMKLCVEPIVLFRLRFDLYLLNNNLSENRQRSDTDPGYFHASKSTLSVVAVTLTIWSSHAGLAPFDFLLRLYLDGIVKSQVLLLHNREKQQVLTSSSPVV